METLLWYLSKSSVWIMGFALIYFLFLRNERFFFLNRIFMIAGILTALVFPFISWRYSVELHPNRMNIISYLAEKPVSSKPRVQESFNWQTGVLLLYFTGLVFVIIRTICQLVPIIKSIKETEIVRQKTVKIIATARFENSFSFFSYVFVNPSINKTEMNEIMNHEKEHIRQKHWIDLLLLELLRVVQWFNPVVWFYGRELKQNHEYLADKQALRRSLNPGVYHAALLNHVFGGSVISLANSFNYSFNKKRFKMMQHKKQSPLRKLKLIFIIPVIAGIFYAFSTPEYIQKEKNSTATEQKNAIKVGSINWKNNTVYTSKQLDKALGIKSGDKCTQEELDEQLGQIFDLYLNNGYLFFNVKKLEPVTNHEKIDLTFEIYEGRPFKVRNVTIKGNTQMPSTEITDILEIKSGDLFSKEKFNKSYQTLIKRCTSVSEEVLPDIEPDKSTFSMEYGAVDIVFNVVKK